MALISDPDTPRRTAWSTPHLRSAGVHGTRSETGATDDNSTISATSVQPPGPTPTPAGS